jgi:glycosyltransferase involved in cell wall biosynthesis
MTPVQPAVVAADLTPTRVLAVIDWLEIGGAQQHLLTLATTLAKVNCDFVVATSGDEPLAETFRGEGIPVRSLARRPIKHRVSPVFTARLARLAAGGEFDLIHSHLHSASLAAAVAARLTGLPLVVTHHSMNTWRSAWDNVLGRWADRQADAVIAVATNVAAAVARGGVRARVIPNGVAVAPRPWSAAEIAAARAALSLPSEAYVVGYVGRFSQDKNPLLFVEMAALVAPRCPSAQFLMLGDGPLRAAAEERAHVLGLGPRLRFAGFRPNASELLPLLDVLALTSDSEGSPLIVLEAMAAGRPVVATSVGDVPSQIVDGETGFLVEPRNVAGLASAVVRLIDETLRDRMGWTGRERAARHFSIADRLAETAGVYREVLERRAVAGLPRARRGASAIGQ